MTAASRPYETGSTPGSGTFFCVGCGWHLALEDTDQLPHCPQCGRRAFQRDSIFESMQEHAQQTLEMFVPAPRERPGWLDEARAMLPGAGPHLVYRDDEEEIRVVAVEPGWMRIGRSQAADLRLDDPSVSRRHALIIFEPPSTLRILDDRSLNGVLLNGEPVEWGRLEDGDALTIGRYCVYALVAE
jgi:predicted  nucleic acid-binding Zn-ribbon protein